VTDPVEAMRARAKQARRLAAHRTTLLQTGAFTVAELAAVRGQDEARTRMWLARQIGDRALITVTHDGERLVPAFQLTAAGDPRPELQPLLEVLVGADLGDWATWTWLTTPSAFLSGERPVDVAVSNPPRARRSAERFAWAPSGA
jgi:hypothetical protein